MFKSIYNECVRLGNYVNEIILKQLLINLYFIYAFINSIILSISTGLIVTFLGLIISLILVKEWSNLIKQQIITSINKVGYSIGEIS